MAPKYSAPSGTRDFLPDALALRYHVIDIIKKVYTLHGYQPLETPAFENLNVLTGKYGDEGDKLIFRLLHRGEKLQRTLEKGNLTQGDLAETGLRYDLTVPLARVYSANREVLTGTFKRFQIQPVWRADRPAKGRFREFYQCDVDIIGSGQILAEMDIFCAVTEIMNEIGIEKFWLSVNDRRILRGMLAGLEIPENLHNQVLTILDKLDKMPPEAIRDELVKMGISEKAVVTLSDLILKVETSCASDLIDYVRSFSHRDYAGGIEDMEKILHWSKGLGIDENIKFSPVLARGLDYYTGPIYELKIDGYSSSFGGGGRYDGLIGIFSGENIPAVGFSFGLERIIDFLTDRGMHKVSSVPAVTLGILDEKYFEFGYSILTALRSNQIAADLFPEFAKPAKILKWANRKQIPFVLLIGEEEFVNRKISFKNLNTGEQLSISLPELLTKFQK
ncbi:histidine--tRNA ligase [Myxococcota bacterium]|nr:histidine--tRNA ligase [Myxococcota bacterium]MBU1382527.1 histidine--tRNA ligase [Myxococcota bacterium]MBU1497212.1 histidine--tRNA ligase [Myxococcota bacterium]